MGCLCTHLHQPLWCCSGFVHFLLLSLRALQQAGDGLDLRYIHIWLGEILTREKKKILVIVICRFILHLRDLKCRDCPCLGRSPAPSLWVLWCLSRTREGRISTWGNLRWWIATTSPRTHVKIAQGERKPGDIGSHCSGEELSKFLDCFPPQHRGCGLSLAWCFSHWNAQAACGKGKWPPARIWPSGSKETTLIPTPRGFGPPYPAQRVKPKHTSLGWLELKPPFACLELDNLSDTSCCTLCPLGHLLLCYSLPEECGMLWKGKRLQPCLLK